jgi:hypothetical protein
LLKIPQDLGLGSLTVEQRFECNTLSSQDLRLDPALACYYPSIGGRADLVEAYDGVKDKHISKRIKLLSEREVFMPHKNFQSDVSDAPSYA